jgi:hypothetical protein
VTTRIVLALSAVIWLPYGVYCFFAPDALAGIAGVTAGSTTGSIELRAMYGGLQLAIGALAGAGALRAALERPALVALAFLCAGLFLARTAGALFEGELSAYTASGLVFELGSALLVGWRLASPASPAATA